VDSPVKKPRASQMARCAPPYTDRAGEEPCQGGVLKAELYSRSAEAYGVRRSVVISKLGYLQALSFPFTAHTVYETVFIRNPSRPPSTEIAFERLRFSYPVERHPPSRLYKFVETS